MSMIRKERKKNTLHDSDGQSHCGCFTYCQYFLWFATALAIFIVAFHYLYVHIHAGEFSSHRVQKSYLDLDGYAHEQILFDSGQSLQVIIADTQDKRTQGLSGSTLLELGHNQGMFFVFEKEGFHTIWMKDMNYPLDIFWFDAQGRLTDEQRNVSQYSFPEIFGKTAVSQYVLETPVGTLDEISYIYR